MFGAISISQHATGGTMVDFVTKYLKAKRIAWINHVDAYGNWNLEAAEYQLQRENPGVRLVAIERVDREINDVTSVALKVKSANADVVCIMTYDRPGAMLIKGLYDMGIKCPIVLATNGNQNMLNTVKAVGVKEAFSNFYYQDCSGHQPDGATGAEWATKMYREYYPDFAKLPEFPATTMYQGLASTRVVTQALTDAGPDLTREKYLKALEAMRNFDTGGLVAGPISFSSENHAGQNAAVFLKFEAINPVEGSYKQTLTEGVFRNIWKWEAKK
jgi:branched-chain amino acid transport system substrate-binding protein